MTDEQPLTLSEPRCTPGVTFSGEGDPHWDPTTLVAKLPFSTPAFIPQVSHSSNFTTVFTPADLADFTLPADLAGAESSVWLPSMPSIPWHPEPWAGRSLEMSSAHQRVTQGSPAPDTACAVRQTLPYSDGYLETTGQGRWEGKQGGLPPDRRCPVSTPPRTLQQVMPSLLRAAAPIASREHDYKSHSVPSKSCPAPPRTDGNRICR